MEPLDIFLFCGGTIIRDEQVPGGWRTCREELTPDGLIWYDWIRPIAGHRLYVGRPGSRIIASGFQSRSQYLDLAVNPPALAEVVRRELVELGVPNEYLELETETTTTRDQLLVIQQMMLAGKFAAGSRRLVLLSNRYHVYRILAMIRGFGDLAQLREVLTVGQVLAAEDILLQHDPARWQSEFTRVYGSRAMQERIRREMQGISDIMTGKYH